MNNNCKKFKYLASFRINVLMIFFSAVSLLSLPAAHLEASGKATADAERNTFPDGFASSPFFEERILSFNYEPEIKVEINAPGEKQFDPSKKIMLIFYALPNMNSIEQTIGKKVENGDDWHFNIQHIGAQTRFLRNEIKDYNSIVVYMATDQESWPWWKMRHPDGDLIIRNVTDSVKNIFKGFNVEVSLCSHSGGGTFVLGFINSFNKIPGYIKRISFIDSEYDYSESLKQGDKLARWLKDEPDHFLSIIAYDDRDVLIDGKNIGTLNGGTFYRSSLMKENLEQSFQLKDESDSLFKKFTGLNGRINIQLKLNPDHQMWHTVLVEDNGFIHSMVTGTLLENKDYTFWGARAYSQYIQP